MSMEDKQFIINGPPPFLPLLRIPLGQLFYDSLSQIAQNDDALEDGFTGESISRQQLLLDSCLLAKALLKAGFGKGSFNGIYSENHINYFTPVLSSLYVGAVVVPINNTYTPNELTHVLGLSNLKIIFCSKNTLPKLLCLNIKIEKLILIDTDENIEGATTMKNFIRDVLGCLQQVSDIPNISIDFDEHPAFIVNSSGTTGLSKGVIITHKNFMVKLINSMDPKFAYLGLKSNAEMGLLPFFHVLGLGRCLTAILFNRKIIVMNYFDANIYLKTIEKYQIYYISLVPSLAIFLAKNPIVDKFDLSCIKVVGCSASSLSKEVEDLLKKRLKVDCLRQAYGLTETTFGCIYHAEGENVPPGSVGKMVPFMSCKVQNIDNGKLLGANEVGELYLKGSMIMKGYLNNIEATKETFTNDGWLKTGDLGYYDEQKYFYIVGRIKELIKYKGFQVPPAELEAILLTNPGISDAAVIGSPDESAGELPVAFIVKNDPNISEIDVQKFVEDKVSPHKKLRGGVIFVSNIPKTASGKILRGELKKLLKEHQSNS